MRLMVPWPGVASSGVNSTVNFGSCMWTTKCRSCPRRPRSIRTKWEKFIGCARRLPHPAGGSRPNSPPDLALRNRLLRTKRSVRATRPMNLDPAPRHSKLVFLAIDAGLLLTAFIVVYFAKNPYAPLPFVSALLCVVAAAIIGLVPFLTDYAADSAEYVQAEQARVAEQAQRLHAATETLTRAAAQIKGIEEAVHKSAHAAENLPYRMQEKLAEFNETLAAKDTEDREALERELDELRAANSNQLKAVAEWTALEAAARKQLTAVQDASAKLNDQFKANLAELDARIAALSRAAAN